MAEQASPDGGVFEYHPNCEPPDFQFSSTGNHAPSRQVEQMKGDIDEIIRWADRNSVRSQQITLGPSELGVNCDRRIAYGVAAIPPVNIYTDPWPAIVGTAIHQWLEAAIIKYQEKTGTNRWITEVTVEPDPLVRGHLDVYDSQTKTVGDFKSLGTTRMKIWKTDGPPIKHWQQVNLYARGLINQGISVEKVALIGIPRAGWLSDMTVYIEDYDASLAQSALDRMYRIATQVLELEGNPDPYAMIQANPERGDCQWCPWFKVRAKGPGCSGVA